MRNSSQQQQSPPVGSVQEDGITYQTGFGNTFESEFVPNSLPRGRNNPRLVPFGLYAEQLSGTAFTKPRHVNRRVWLYRSRPSVSGTHHLFNKIQDLFGISQGTTTHVNPNPMRWNPMPLSTGSNFVTGLKLLAKSGSPLTKFGLAIYMYSFDQDMVRQHLYNSDGDFLIVPQMGALFITTELGKLIVHPKEICIIPRGIVFSVKSIDGTSTRGYVLEVYAGHFQLPELGPIGSNGLANARDFWHPTAWACLDDKTESSHVIYTKFGEALFERVSPHSPYNVVAWHGNYVPYKYNLTNFCSINSVSYDHLDPSIYTVLTCAGASEGEALADFVIFPPRIMATDSNTLRPPWFHRNCMTEFMGLIDGSYDAKKGFAAGGASLHSCMTPHGPDALMYGKAVEDECAAPVRFDGGLAFMFETTCMLELTDYAIMCEHRDLDYAECWSGLQNTKEAYEAIKDAVTAAGEDEEDK
jgi:homogentisate 1,2-dioxygenase